MAPPVPSEVLPETVVLVRFIVLPANMPMPPPRAEELLPVMEQLSRVSLPSAAETPMPLTRKPGRGAWMRKPATMSPAAVIRMMLLLPRLRT